MPEGPEIRRIADWIRQGIDGAVINRVEFGAKKHAARGEEFAMRRVTGVESRAKTIVIHADHGWSIFTHTQLYGRWFVLEHGEGVPGKRKLGVSIKTTNKIATLTSTQRIEPWPTADLDTHPFLGKLGPDVLDDATTTDDLREILDRSSGAQLGELLLNQSSFAGVGNYLRSEILFLTGLRPEHTPRMLTDDQLDRFADTVLATSRRAYASGGYTTDEAHIAAGEAKGLTKDEIKRYVYKHHDEPCPRCSTTIVMQEYLKRKVYLCPSCQPAP